MSASDLGEETHTDTRLAIRTALLALSDKSDSEALAHALVEHGATIYATTGTASYLRGLGFTVEPAERLTGTAEILGGRVKTLSSDLFGAILARRGHEEDEGELQKRGLPAIDLVCVTLYPFERLPDDADWNKAVESIDVGGVALLRAAAKNFDAVSVVSSPSQYEAVRAALRLGGTTLEERRRWARAAYERTAEYDATIAGFFRARDDAAMPDAWVRAYRRARSLRYGENPHQEAALYAESGRRPWWASGALVENKELSYNNLVDLEAAGEIAHDFVRPACVVVKHNEPSGVGLGDSPAAAYRRAVAADPLSAFGGIVAFNVEVDADTAAAMSGQFVECVAAPSYSPAAQAVFAKRKNLRIVELPAAPFRRADWSARPVRDGLLVQRARPDAGEIHLQVVTRRAPTPDEMEALHFAWTVVGRARSNAVVIARAEGTLGIGSGQTSRVDALAVALMKARRCGHDVRGAVLASDGFFPFGDWVEMAHEAGLTACIQPGGSMRDAESVAACDAAGLAMVFTGRRQFRH